VLVAGLSGTSAQAWVATRKRASGFHRGGSSDMGSCGMQAEESNKMANASFTVKRLVPCQGMPADVVHAA